MFATLPAKAWFPVPLLPTSSAKTIRVEDPTCQQPGSVGVEEMLADGGLNDRQRPSEPACSAEIRFRDALGSDNPIRASDRARGVVVHDGKRKDPKHEAVAG